LLATDSNRTVQLPSSTNPTILADPIEGSDITDGSLDGDKLAMIDSIDSTNFVVTFYWVNTLIEL
jgi:hypothetical protein